MRRVCFILSCSTPDSRIGRLEFFQWKKNQLKQDKLTLYLEGLKEVGLLHTITKHSGSSVGLAVEFYDHLTITPDAYTLILASDNPIYMA